MWQHQHWHETSPVILPGFFFVGVDGGLGLGE